jgi:monovalent cation:H+ antiporter-2, CPA2 family
MPVSHPPVENLFGVLTVMLLTAIVVSLLLHRVRQSVVVGYIFCGVLIGPFGLRLVTDAGQIRMLSEFGVMLLLFNLGIEFSVTELKQLRRIAVAGGTVQMITSALLLAAVVWGLGIAPRTALLLGLIGSISSTALVLKIFQESAHAWDTAARLALGIAIFQDLVAVGLMLVLPAFAGAGGTPLPAALGGALGKGVLFLAASYLLNRFVIPQALRRVSLTRSRELFTLSVIALCAGIAWLASLFGLSLALGAFVAGLLVSDTIYSHKILADVLPFKDFFLTLFFVSIGLLLDVHFLLEHWLLVAGLVVVTIVIKAACGIAGGWAAGFTPVPAAAAGLGLSSVGEFSFVLLGAAAAQGLIGADRYSLFLACAALSMSATPMLMQWAVPLGRWLERWPALRQPGARRDTSRSRRLSDLENHAVICGYGHIGETLNATLRRLGVETLVIDLNAVTIERLVKEGQLCLFADVAQAETLRLARLEKARVLAITIPDFQSTRAAVKAAREISPDAFLICRARFPRHVEPLRKLGVHAVVSEEAETSFEIIHRSLEACERRPEEIEEALRQLRYEYGVER